jgi:O-antigen ligase
VLSGAIFSGLLALLVFTVIPYGTAEPWWKAFFVCCTFALTVLWIIDGSLRGSWTTGGRALLLPLAALAEFSMLQTFRLPVSGPTAEIAEPVWSAISADPYGTRFFALQLVGLALAGALLFRYAGSDRRLRVVTHVIIGVAVASALFGILRQATQHSVGFGLPRIQPDQGYGQFFNRNHFAFLMELGFGLALGILIGGGIKRERVLIYLGALFPIWTALVLSNSRGGLLAMLAQVLVAALLITLLPRSSRERGDGRQALRLFQSWPARAVLLAVLLTGVVVGTFWLGGDRLVTRLEQSQEFNPGASELRQNVRRNQIWRATWKMFEAHPIAGVGMGGYWAAIPTFHDASGLMTPQEAHNEYLELLASGGLIGFACGVWFIVVLFRKAHLNLQSSSGFRRAACLGAILGIIGVGVHSLVDFGLHMLGNALLLMALVVIATAAVPTTETLHARND